MASLKNHPGMFLNSGAAGSVGRMEDERGSVIPISSAGRLKAEQQALINRYARGGAANRPPYLFKPFTPAEGSPHVKNGGEAIDIPNAAAREWVRVHGAKHGWRFNVPSDTVHAIYEPNRDQFAGASQGPLGHKQDTINRQTFLNTIGYKLKVDGVEGFETDQAYRGYQTDLKIQGLYTGEIDGAWGPLMESAHAKWVGKNRPPAAPAPAAPAPAGSTRKNADGPALLAVQKVLKSRYPLYAGKLKLDGRDGPFTQAAIAEFQRRAGLTPDAIAGPKTRKALGL